MKDISPFVGEYVSFLKQFLRPKKPLKIVFDCSNGSSGPVVRQLITGNKKLKTKNIIRGIIINEQPDGHFPNHSPNPLHAGSLTMLRQRVVKEKADFGIIFDADGDRMFCVDNKGRFVNPDAVAYLLLWSLRPKKFISDLKAGWLIKQHPFAAKRIESRTGHYFIKQAMRKYAAELGHEESGHYYFKNFFHCDSGIMAAVEVLNAVSQLPYALSDFVDLLPITVKSWEINVPVRDASAVVGRIEAAYKKDAIRISKLDGITMEFKNPDWWFNVRPSNTEPVIRLNMEALDKKVYNAQLKKLTELLKQASK